MAPLYLGSSRTSSGFAGPGVPAGGSTNQVLRKTSNTDYATEWFTLAGGGNAQTANPLSQFAATTSAQFLGVISDETGTGLVVFNNGPTLIAPVLGTPASGTLTSCTGLPIATGVSGLGTGIATALAVNAGSAGAPVLLGGSLGTPSSGTLTSCTGLPATGVTGLATVATTGAYGDLSGRPTLGTAAATASTDYAPAAQGVTNGNSHDHNGGDGAQIAYSSLSGLPTLPTGTNTGDQAIASTSDATSHTITLSASGGTVQFVEGANITLTTTGTSSAGVVTIASTGSGGGGDAFRWFGAADFIPRTTAGCGVNSDETATNRVNRDLLLFDAGTQEHAQIWFAWPTGWNTFSAIFFCKYTTGSGNWVMGAQARLYEDNTAQDTAFGTAQTVTDNGLGVNIHHQSAATPGITPGGTVADGRPCALQIYRDATNGSDTLGVDLEVIGVMLTKVT